MDKVYNKNTGRWVLKTGKIGKAIIRQNHVTLESISDGISGKSSTVVDLLTLEAPSEERTFALNFMERMKKATAELDRLNL
jgi:hypothetical protein